MNVKIVLSSTIVVGVLVSIFGLVSFFGSGPLINSIVKNTLLVLEGTKSYENWQKIPLAITNRIYLFNITNVNEVLNGSKHILQQVGPFVYEERREKIDIEWNKDQSEVTYRTRRRWFFREDLSEGSLNDYIYHLNVPLVSAGEFVRRYPGDFFEKDFLYTSINNLQEMTNSVLYPRHTIRELLFEGYDDPMISEVKDVMPIPYDKFGWFYPKNDSSTDGTFTIFTGVKDINNLGLLTSWHAADNVTTFHNFCGSYYDGISGGDFLPPFQEKASSIQLFVGEICRPLKLQFDKNVDHFGLNTHRYKVDQSLFDYFLDENKCYCPPDAGCPSNGVANVSACVFNSTAAISLPHFLYADPKYSQQVHGMEPNESEHGFHFDIFPDWGIPFDVKVSMQINIVHVKDANLTFASNLTQDEVYIPMVYFVAEASLDESMADQLKLVQKLPIILYYLSIALVILGLFISRLFVFLYRKQGYKMLREPVSENLTPM